MEKILAADPFALRILGAQSRRPDAVYRLLEHCVQCPVPEGMLLFNNMTKELLLLSPEEMARLPELEALISGWFLVPKEQDDRLLADQLKDLAAHLRRKAKNIFSYTIFTTMDCNARCFYCFERDRQRASMSLETAAQTARFIMENAGKNNVNLRWFGGEPLYNAGVIDLICGKLREANVKFVSSMTSNGYLFDGETVRKAVEVWNLKEVQITLDGTEQVYNHTKAYVDAADSPYQRVLDNIDRLLDAGLRVVIRLNLGRRNGEDLFRLVDELAERFGGKKGFIVYANVLLVQDEPALGEQGWHKDETVYEELSELRKYISDYGLNGLERTRRYIRTSSCMADNECAVTVLPDGSLGRCEHFSESELTGHISVGQSEKSVVDSWKEQSVKGGVCEGCICYADCIRLRKCPNGSICIPQERKLYEEHLRQCVLNEYHAFLERRSQ